MATLEIQDEALFERLKAVAEQENRSVESVLATLLEFYTVKAEALRAMDGMFDDDITDLSTTVRETMYRFYKEKENDAE